ncbi:MAG: KAP family NTPase, partial [Thiomicrorhabdus sp.]|nr:KAP family NTPase [Thiomicrorhabdus sp.]
EITDKKPIIIVIDELDRCRPDYSVSMLEYIKHIFNINKIQFILVTNTEQLKSSVNHSYGASINAQKYLDKFVSYSFTLPQMINHREDYVSVVHMQGLLEASTVLQNSILAKPGIFELIEILIKVNHLSLREVETFVRYLEIYQIVTEDSGLANNTIFGFGLLRVLSVFIFCFHCKKAETLSGGSIDCLFISEILGTSSLLDLESGDRANINDTLVALFRVESKMPAGEFEASYEKNREAWVYEIRGLFSGPGFSLGSEKLLNILTDTIYDLKLS